MRKLLACITAIMMVLGMAACSSSESAATDTAEAAVIGLLDAIKAVDQTKINEYVTPEDDMYFEETMSEEEIETSKLLFENMTYTVTSSEETENSAIVKVDISTLDMVTIMQKYAESVMGDTSAEELTQQDATRILKETIEANKDETVSSSVELTVNKTDTGWKVETNESFQSAITGGMAEMF